MPNRPRTHKADVPKPRRSAKVYSRKKWRGIRVRHLSRNPACPCGEVATEVDHVDGNPENNAADNLQSYCKSCHAKKTYRCDSPIGKRPC